MRLLRRAGEFDAAVAAAEIVAAAAAERPELVLGLATGRTMIPVYRELERRHRTGVLDLSRARAFNLDELLMPPEHPASFRSYMERHAWRRIGLDPERCDIPDPLVDPASECRRYDRALAAAGGFDLVVLGVGADGHVAYNLPGRVREGTHVVELPSAVASRFEVPEAWRPLRAITVGIDVLRAAGRLVLLATSADKREAIASLLHGPADPQWPVTLLREHPDFDLVVTDAALEQGAVG